MVLAQPAAADEAGGRPSCDVQAEVAERVMRHRQQFNDLESTWRMAGLIRNLELSRVAQRLVAEAYKRPRQAGDEERERVTNEFSEEVRDACKMGSDRANASF